MTGEWERNAVAEDWLGIGPASVYMGIVSGSEHLSGNAPPRTRGRAETAKRSIADRSWKELTLALSLAIHYAWGDAKLFLAGASSKVASYPLPGKPPQVTAEAMNV